MKWIYWLERRLGRFAIPGLVTYLVFGQAAVFVLNLAQPGSVELLFFDPGLIARGQWWRLVGFVLIPPRMNVFFLFFALYFLYMIGQGVERAWGSFRLNLFYFLGVAAHVGVGYLFGGGLTPDYLNLSLFLVFGTLYPDFEVLFFFILPIRMRWLAVLDAALLLLAVIGGGPVFGLCALFSLADYLLFFGPELWSLMRLKRQVIENRVEFESSSVSAVVQAPPKRCAECGQTHEQGADIRLCTCAACGEEGKYWCMAHLAPHLAPVPSPPSPGSSKPAAGPSSRRAKAPTKPPAAPRP